MPTLSRRWDYASPLCWPRTYDRKRDDDDDDNAEARIAGRGGEKRRRDDAGEGDLLEDDRQPDASADIPNVMECDGGAEALAPYVVVALLLDQLRFGIRFM